jgi:PKHD-type hydroxylase
MLVQIPDLLTPNEVALCRATLKAADWVDGKVTAGAQSSEAKTNLQVPENSPQGRQLGDVVLRALGRNPIFTAAALPLRVFPPLFNRYDTGMGFESHVDNAIRFVTGANVRERTDISVTVFLTDLKDYDGGELIVEDTYGEQSVRFPAGHAVLYPATSLHRVAPITRGSRWASFFWVQSMIKDDGKRRELYDLDRAITETRIALGDKHHASVALTAVYHNLIRRWSEL